MLLVFVMGVSVGVVVLAVSIDVGTAYLAERPPREKMNLKQRKEKLVQAIEDDYIVRKAVARYREIKRRELGVFTIGQRPPQRAPGVHRRVKAL